MHFCSVQVKTLYVLYLPQIIKSACSVSSQLSVSFKKCLEYVADILFIAQITLITGLSDL